MTGRQGTEGRKPRRPATTPEGREQQLAGLAYDLAEEQLLAGTASAQVITHFLKAGSAREVLERQRIEHENELLRVKAESIANAESQAELVKNAIEAFRTYVSSASEGQDDYEA